MKPQLPVTRIRTARASSAEAGALADFPLLGDSIEIWKNALAEASWTPWLIIGLAAFLRFFLLGMKPPHFDEGINGWFVDQMVKNAFYKYDPTNYHGPLHFYVLLLSQTLLGRNLWALRLPVVLVSISCVWLTLKFEPFVGRTVCRLAALAMAVSPGFVFYGRYSIHEVWLLLFTILFFYGLFGLWKFGTTNYLWCAGMGLTGMILSKETYLLHVACAVIAAGVCYISNYFNKLDDSRPATQTWNYVDLAVVVGTGVGLIVFFYSGTFFHWSGVKGLYQAYLPWFKTGSEGHGHEKPYYYWLRLIARYEWPVLAGLILCLFSIRFKQMPLRYLAIYGVGTVMAYSIVKYKTPWCIISFIWPFIFIFGAAVLITPLRYKRAVYLISAILLAGSLGYCIWLNYFRCTTETEPYVYVQTYNDVYKFTDPILQLAHSDPRAYQLVGHIIRASPYPLPWMLDDFGRVGYYEKDNLPDKVDGDFLLVQHDKIATIEAKLHDPYYTMPITIRPYQDPSKAYFNARIFKSFFPGKWPDFTGAAPAPSPNATPAPSPNK
ncbi:MAG TPA: flippase activity-associated protein Agl23 [Chthoniobacterales bacterium]|nr:flippase activity-associated protein Agl23 [Chthoniobacterales bacterium]